jgi:hypothetical protein
VAAVIDKPRVVTKKSVEARLRDWERRLRELFARVERWSIAEWGEGCVTHGKIVPLSEYRMEEAGVRPRRLPTLTVQAGPRTITFEPRCLWIIAANGAVDVSVECGPRSRQPAVFHALYDMGGEDGQPSDWQIRNRDPRKVLEPFTKEVLLRISSGRP